MYFFRKKQNLVFSSIILFLVIILVVMSVLLFKKGEENLKNATQTAASNTGQLEQSGKNERELKNRLDSANAENSRLESEKKALEDENSRLKKQLTSLAAKKQAAAASALAEATRKRTEAIIARLSLPVVEQEALMPGVCYLTFDDGPSNNTLSILNTLQIYNVKATFFVTGKGTTPYIKNIYDAGHSIGLHTNTHNYAGIYKSVEAYFTDLEAISDTVFSLTGVRSRIVRFPGGSSNTVSKTYCNGIMTDLTVRLPQMGYCYYDWNVSSGDAASKKPTAAAITNNVLSGANGKDSICVLMHDSADKDTTAAALPAIIEGLVERNFRFEAITPGTFGYHHGVKN